MSPARASMLGGIVGDAFGSPYQFRQRGTFTVHDNMLPCAHFRTPPGTFTDDSSMMLCLASSLIATGRFDPVDQMDRYAHWLCDGYMSSMNRAFDIGRTTMDSVGAYARDKAEGLTADGPYGLAGEQFCGNGGIMRLAPVVVWAATREGSMDLARRQSAVTHANRKCLDCAALMARVLWDLLHGVPKEAALDAEDMAGEVHDEEVRALCRGEYKNKPAADVETSGYVVHTLEAALWTLWNTNSYEEGIKVLAAMGDDADTTCCVFGQLAGALYGEEAIPERWLAALRHREAVESVMDGLMHERDVAHELHNPPITPASSK